MKKKFIIGVITMVVMVITLNANIIVNKENLKTVDIKTLLKTPAVQDDPEGPDPVIDHGRPLGLVGDKYYCWSCTGTDCRAACSN